MEGPLICMTLVVIILAGFMLFGLSNKADSVYNQTCFKVEHVQSGNSAVMHFNGHTYDNVVIKECPLTSGQ